jgi:hypothetical protein
LHYRAGSAGDRHEINSPFEGEDWQGALERLQKALSLIPDLCEFELGDMERAGDELTRAYMGGDKEIFDGEDEKYCRFVNSILLPRQDA